MIRVWLLVKPVPVAGLAVWVLRAPKSPYRNRLAAGLALSAAGDFLIELSFIGGLIAFLLAHLAYTAAFLAGARRWHLLRALPVAAYAAVVNVFLWPGLGVMRPALLTYTLAIGVMIWRAAARIGLLGAATRGEWAALAGAILFAASDSLIALDRFHAPMPGARVPIMLLYWAGQIGIASSARLR